MTQKVCQFYHQHILISNQNCNQQDFNIYSYKSHLDIPYSLYRILTVGNSGSGKSNALLNLIKHQLPDVDKIYLSFKSPFESKYQILINGGEKK